MITTRHAMPLGIATLLFLVVLFCSYAVARADTNPFTPQFDFTINDSGITASGSIPGLGTSTGFNINEPFDPAFPIPFPLCRLTIKKVVVGGTAQPQDFQIHVLQNGADLPGSPAAGSSSGTQYQNLSGTGFSVSESGGPAGYQASYSGDCDASGALHLSITGNIACTITNTFTGGGGTGGSASTGGSLTGTVTATSTSGSSGGSLTGSVGSSTLTGTVGGGSTLTGTVSTGNTLTGTVGSGNSLTGTVGGGGGGSGGGGGGGGGNGPIAGGGGGGGGGPGIPNTGGGGPTTSIPTPPQLGNESVSTPGIPNTGAGGQMPLTLAILVLSGVTALWSPRFFRTH